MLILFLLFTFYDLIVLSLCHLCQSFCVRACCWVFWPIRNWMDCFPSFPTGSSCVRARYRFFHMNMNEMVTLKSYNIPVVVMVFNNQVLGMVRQWQKLFYGRRFSSTDPHRATDFVAAAKAFGIDAFSVSQSEEIAPVLQQAVEMHKPVLIDFHISPDANVLPMIPPGKDVDDMILYLD